jgi:hypothetical protein
MRAAAGMQTLCMRAQVYVFCSAHAEQVKQHLETAGWLQERSSFHVKVAYGIVTVSACFNRQPACMHAWRGSQACTLTHAKPDL